jgi:uncharacterized Zn finger protein
MPRKKALSKRVPKQRSIQRTSIRGWLEKQSKKELIDTILEVAQEHPRVRELLADRASLKQGKISPIREAIRKDIEALEPDWSDGDTFDVDSDFVHIAERLAALLDAGCADDVIVSDILAKRLQTQPVPGNNAAFSNCYKRGNLSRWLQTALERSGRQTDVIDLLQREAPITHCYDQLVSALLTAGREQEAHDWIAEGFAKTIDKLPGIAWRLAEQLRDLATRKKQYANIASLLALEFLYRPDTALYCKLEKAAKRIRCWPAVRESLLAYLETGVRPDLQPTKKHKTRAISSNWPLPKSDLLLPNSKRVANLFPNTGVLIHIAIYEKRPDEVLKWYHLGKKRRLYHSSTDNSVAEAVKSTHPDEALAIWKRRAEWEIDRVKPAAYKVAAPYLKKIRVLYRNQKRADEWNNYLLDLRQQHKAKRRLIEILDAL